MSRDDIQKLLGGYATGTLTPEEQQALFEASLDDQELFDALAREQALRDLLRDPAAKAHLLAALDQHPLRWYQRLAGGWRLPAAALAMAGVCAIAVMLVRQSGRTAAPLMVAQLRPPSAPNSLPAPQAESAAKPLPPAIATGAKDALKRRLAKESPTRRALDNEEDRRSKVKQLAQAAEPKDAAESAPSVSTGAVAAPVALPPTPGSVASGFRAGGMAGAGGGILGGVPARPPVAAARQFSPSQAPSPTPAQQGQMGAQSQLDQVQAAQVQVQGTRSQVAQARLERSQMATAVEDAFLVNGSVGALNTTGRDARSLFYGTAAEAGLKKTSGQQEKADKPQAAGGRQAVTVNALAATVKAPARALNPGVRYSLLRKNPAGGFDLVDPESVKTGDILELQLQPNSGGMLAVRERTGDGPWQEVMSTRVEALKMYQTEPIESGEKELEVSLARMPAAVTGLQLRDDKSAHNTFQQSTAELATYVVTDPASSQLLFKITLK